MSEKNNGICHIVGAAEINSLRLKKGENDIIIAADGGQITLNNYGIVPDMLIGDFDSSSMPTDRDNIIKLNPIKDITDTMRAVEYGEEQGYKSFLVYGGLGGRTSHTIANIQMMAEMAERGVKCSLVGDNEVLTVLHNGKISFDSSSVGFVSVFSLNDRALGVSESGLKYTLDNYTMTNNYPLGVSNEFIGERATISVKDGSLLIIYSTNAEIE